EGLHREQDAGEHEREPPAPRAEVVLVHHQERRAVLGGEGVGVEAADLQAAVAETRVLGPGAGAHDDASSEASILSIDSGADTPRMRSVFATACLAAAASQRRAWVRSASSGITLHP